MPALALDQPALDDPVTRGQHRRRGETDAVAGREGQIVVRILAPDLVGGPDARAVDGGDGLAVEDCSRRVAVLGLVGGVEGELLLEALDFRERALEVGDGRGAGDGGGCCELGVRCGAAQVGGWADEPVGCWGHGGGFVGDVRDGVGGVGGVLAVVWVVDGAAVCAAAGGCVGDFLGRAVVALSAEDGGEALADAEVGEVVLEVAGGCQRGQGGTDAGREAVFVPVLDGEEVDAVFFLGTFVDEAAAVFGEEGEARPEGEVHLRGEHAGAQEDLVSVAQGPEDVDAVLWDACVEDTGKELGPLVDGMACNQTTQAVGNDIRSSLFGWHIGCIGREAFKEFDQFLREQVRAQSPIVAVVPDAELAIDGVVALLQSLHQPAADVHGPDMRQHARGNDRFLHPLFVFRVQADFEVHLAKIESHFHWNPQLAMRRFGRAQDRAPVAS